MPRSTSRHRRRRRETARRRLVELLALAALPFAACFAEPNDAGYTPSEPAAGTLGGSRATSAGGSDRTPRGGTGASSSGTEGGAFDWGGSGGSAGVPLPGGGAGEPAGLACPGAVAQPLPARGVLISDRAPDPVQSGPKLLTREALYRSFVSVGCGQTKCHGGSGNPLAEPPDTFQVTLDTFDQRPTLGDEAVERVLSSDSTEVMPPPPDGIPDGSTRGPDDPARVLAERLLAWQKAGFPDSFVDPHETRADATTPSSDPYLLSPKLPPLTNLGSCIPNATAMLAPAALDSAATEEMQQKDAMFASLETSDDLPDTIYETDLVSLDSYELGRRRVFSYAPTYPLFSDAAGKMRYVRVPLGKSIRYDESLHDFVIPDNTRFYKTFLKPVIDANGKLGYRKMETRLIVVRQDTKNADGSYTTHALRASYAWNRDETMAHRVKDPFRNGQPWADRLCPFITDESQPRDPNQNPISPQISEYCEYMTQAELDDPSSGRIRHYAIPSAQRCDQCHMGSSSHSFVLGFTPWQVDRRESGEGGIYEEPKDDELTQLRRLLDYGIVTGIEPGEVKLEESQLIADPPRKPRNDYELEAQGYMLGNCAYCHNPHGFPVVTNPVLQSFELFPSKTGGVFQFPLEKFSPRAKAGPSQIVQLPYITPAIGDINIHSRDQAIGSKEVTKTYNGVPVVDADVPSPDYDGGLFTFFGPWRSLIWRNVYTPFTYAEDNAIYVHMPRNAPGFDCRAQKIMANWMLSIPALPKGGVFDESSSQPLVEIPPDDPKLAFAYGQATLAAKKRVADYAETVTGSWCPSDDDIVDSRVILGVPDPRTGAVSTTPPDFGITGSRVVPDFQFLPNFDDVPDHAHWVPTDTSDAPGKWVPRRSDWKDVLVTRSVTVNDALSKVVDDLQAFHLSPEANQFALESLPLGLWDPQCQSTAEALASPAVGELKSDPLGGPARRWLSGHVTDDGKPGPDTSLRVHSQSRGEVVFHQICQNCHGKDADSKSPLAATILELTGGQTRVANFIDGLFGPRSAPGSYARGEFTVGQGATPDDWQVRYMLFMGLGGTKATIPEVVLDLVATSPFYGQAVTATGGKSPNMLQSAGTLCGAVLGARRVLKDGLGPLLDSTTYNPFAAGTGHYEAWESICTFQNDPVVTAFRASGEVLTSAGVYRATDAAGDWIYPPDAWVGDQDGRAVRGIEPSNTMPWCLVPPANPNDPQDNQVESIAAWNLAAGLGEEELPYCPPGLFANGPDGSTQVEQLAIANDGLGTALPQHQYPFGNQDFIEHWKRRGAMNAGMSAYYYLNGITSGDFTPAKPFDFCVQ